MKWWPVRVILVVSLLLVLAAGCAARAKAAGAKKKAIPAGKARHEALTTLAWEAFAKKDYAAAIARAEECLDDFAPGALSLQRKREAEKAVIPEGKVCEEQRKRVFANGLLNDVAACYYIKGYSAERLGRTDDAEKAYLRGARCTHARVWDAKKESFWCVAEASGIRARALRLPPGPRKALLDELKQAPHERETAKAWNAFNRNDYRTAISHADECIRRFSKQAQELQTKLAKARARIPVGAVTQAQKQKVLANSVLNDVATCLFIKGRCVKSPRPRRRIQPRGS